MAEPENIAIEHATEHLRFGYYGWVDWNGVKVRLIDRNGRLQIAELYMAGIGPWAQMSDVVRRIPFGRIEAWCNEPAIAAWIQHLLPLGPGRNQVPRPSPLWPFFDVAERDQNQAPAPAPAPMSLELSAENRKVAEGRKRPYPDSFYQEVARIYQAAAARTRGPAEAIADANGIEAVTTIHRWVRMARKRGFLPPAARGKAG